MLPCHDRLAVLLLSAMLLAAAGPGGASAAGGVDTHELPAGGLLFVPDDRTTIEAQEVVIARDAVNVTYAVANRSAEPVTRFVSWALPEIDMASLSDEVVVLASSDPRNFAAAAVAVDGANVALAFEQRAWAFARDVTAILEAVSIPLNPMAAGVPEALARLGPEQTRELEERGVILRDDARILPNWSVRTTAFWRQTFEPGKRINIALAYAPVTASGLWRPESVEMARNVYCADAATEAAIAERAAKAGRGLVVHRITYTVASEPGWWAPIAKFRLAVQKPGFEAIVATCFKDLRSAGPTLLEWIGSEHRPGDDIRILFIN